jgi:hypothetical protein
MASFGTPKHGSGKMKANPEKFAVGKTIVRILPPMGTCVDTGEWAVGHAQHFGFSTPRDGDPSKLDYNTFACIREESYIDGEFVTTKSCPICDFTEQKNLEIEEILSKYKASGESEAEIKKLMAPYLSWKKRHNREFSYYINCKEVGGNYKTRKIGYRLKKAISALVREVKDNRGIDIIDANDGLWLVVTRVGEGIGTEYKVDLHREQISKDGDVYDVVKKGPLDPEECDLAMKECYDLHDVGIRSISIEKMKILAESNDDPDIIKRVFRSSDKKRGELSSSPILTSVNKPDPLSLMTEAIDIAKAAKAKAAQTPKKEMPEEVIADLMKLEEECASASSSSESAEVIDDDDEIAKAMAALEAAKAAKAAKAKAAQAPQPQPQTKKIAKELSPEEEEEEFRRNFLAH